MRFSLNEDLRRPVVAKPVDYAAREPIGDTAYAVLAQQLDYRATPFTPRIEEVASSNATWTVERVTLPTGYDDTSFAVQLFLPTDRRSPSGVIFYFPHAGDLVGPVTTGGFDPAAGGIPLDFLRSRAGRWPWWHSTALSNDSGRPSAGGR